MPPDVFTTGNLLNRVGQQYAPPPAGQPPAPQHSAWDVMTHTREGYFSAIQDLNPASHPLTAEQQQVAATEHSASGKGAVTAMQQQGQEALSQLKQLFHMSDPSADPNQKAPEGVLQHFGLAVAAITSLEQSLSSLLSVIPFPAMPALHVLSLSVGLPHAHPSHWPFIPLPSIGPIIPIPYLSGATKVTIGGLPAARCGDMGIGIWCGGFFPLYEVFLGSCNVWVEGARAGRMIFDITKHCIFSTPKPNDPPAGVPLGFPITGTPNVLIGGIPMPSLTNMLLGAAFKAALSGLGKLIKGLWSKLGKFNFIKRIESFINCKILRREPVNILTGEVAVDQLDFKLPWPIELGWVRRYRSGSRRIGLCGVGWETPADARLELDPDGAVLFFTGSGSGGFFVGLPVEEPVRDPLSGGRLVRQGSHLVVHTKDGLSYRFPAPTPERREVLVEVIADLCGNALSFQRDEQGLRELGSSSGQRLVFTAQRGRITEIWQHGPEPEGPHARAKAPAPQLLIRYEYDDSGDLRGVHDALGKPYRFEYQDHCLLRHTDRNGLSFYYEFDRIAPTGRVVRAWGDGKLYDSVIVYDRTERRVRITDSLGHTAVLQLDTNDLPISETDPLGGITRYEYDEIGRTTAVTDPGGLRTEYHYDDRGNLTKLVRPDAVAVELSYDDGDRLLEYKDARGQRWRQEWDERGRLVRQLSPMGAEQRYEYDAAGHLVAYTDPRGKKTQLQRDRCGQLRRLTDPLGHTTELEVDALGNVTRRTDPLGRSTEYRYDLKSRLVGVRTPSGAETRCAYDAEDNLTEYRDPEDRITRLRYCGLGEVAERLQPDGASVRYGYDTEERLISVTNQRGETYSLERDGLGHIVKEVDYWGQAKSYAYNPSGHLARSEDALGRIVGYRCDALGRLVEKQLPDGSSERFAYDLEGNLTSTENPHGRIEREYDADGHLVEERQGDFVLRCTYDAAGNRIQRHSGHGNTVDYQYDALGRVTHIQVNGGDPIRIDRDAAGQIQTETLAPGLVRRYRYTADGQIASQEVSSPTGRKIIHRRYEYDLSGELIRRWDERSGQEQFLYDPMGRVREHIDPEGRISRYLHDPHGDLLRKISQTQGTGRDFARLCEYEGATYLFDAAGNLIEKKDAEGPLKLEWDANNRLTRSQRGEAPATTYGYDAQGRRLFKETAGKRTCFQWDGDALLSDRLPGEGVREFVYYPYSAEALLVISGKESNLFLCEPNGLPTQVLDLSGRVCWSANHCVLAKATEDIRTFINPIRLQGQYHDAETGLAYNRYRYYDNHIGTFASTDPLSLRAGENLYSFAPNIWLWLDPLGLSCGKGDGLKGREFAADGRRHAFREAKRDARIPVSQKPDKVTRVPMTDSDGRVIMGPDHNPIMTREYHYTNSDGQKIVIQDHSAGHQWPDGTTEPPHFNVRPAHDTRGGKVPGTYGHYSFPK